MIKNKHLRIFLFLLLIYIVVIVGFVCGGLIMADSAPFYKKIGDSDARFLPLIEPHRAVKPFGGSGDRDGWYIDLTVYEREYKLYKYHQVSGVEKVAVTSGVIMAYSPATIALSEQDKEEGLQVLHWFVIVPSQKIETGFASEEEFLTYVHTLGIENPLWIGTDEAFQQFKKTGCLVWIPNCE